MSIKEMFLAAPEGQIDPNIKPLIEEWSEPPTALQVLRVLDAMVRFGAGSDFAVNTIDLMMRKTLEVEGQTFEQLVAEAHWRTQPNKQQ